MGITLSKQCRAFVPWAQEAVRFLDYAPAENAFRTAILAGLSGQCKTIPRRYLYDDRGSALFEAMCRAVKRYSMLTLGCSQRSETLKDRQDARLTLPSLSLAQAYEINK